jgi:hypothetical protein
MKGMRSVWITALFTAGMVLIFVGERLLGVGVARGVVTGLGVALSVAAFGVRLGRINIADPARRSVEQLLAGLAAVGLAGLLIYFLQSDLGRWVGLGRASDRSAWLTPLVSALYPLLIAASLIPLWLAEVAYSAVALAPRIEARRIRDAALSGLGLVGALTFAFAVMYIATEKDPTWDFSYFRTAKPGEATRKLVRGLDTPLEAFLFFPPGNDVALEVGEYFRSLEPESTRLKVNNVDAAVDLSRAKELGVSSNGAVVLRSGQRKETLLIPLELERARGDLRKLDQTVQDKAFVLTRPHRTVYVTAGHGERSMDRGTKLDARAHISSLRKLLEALNQDVKVLTAAEGLATEVPADAGAVLIVGPIESFLPEEVAALNRYFMAGGRLLVALDVESTADLGGLLTSLGVNFQKTMLVNDRIFVPQSHTLSDRGNIATVTFSSHPVVTSVAQAQSPYPVVFPTAGYLEDAKGKPTQLTVDYAIRSHPQTFNDLNGNFELDPPAEQRKSWPLVAAAARKTLGNKPGEKTLDSRALVLADSDCLSDGVLEHMGNAYFMLDAGKWLIGEEAVVGNVNKETDVRIEHSRGQDTAYFYLTIFAVPALVLAGGVVGTRRRRHKGRAP